MKLRKILIGASVCSIISLLVTLVVTALGLLEPKKAENSGHDIADLIRDVQKEFPESAVFINNLAHELAGAAAIREFRASESKLREELARLKVEKSELDRIVAAERVAVAEIIRANNRAFEESHRWDDEKSFVINVVSGFVCSGIALLWVKFVRRRNSDSTGHPTPEK